MIGPATTADAVPLPDLAATARLGKRIAAAMRPGDVVALSGPLGAGKTSLARAIIAAADYLGDVPSPTFTLIETYDPPATRIPIAHADFYRLDHPGEAEELGLADYRHGAVLLAEWPERGGDFSGEAGYLGIALATQGEMRWAHVTKGSAWQTRWK